MPKIKENSIDMILCDLPYQRTKNSWDCIIPFEDLWKNYNRIIKNNGVIALFADGMFMADLMISNRKMWKYNLVWDKVLASGFLNAKKQPLRVHEEVVIFYNKKPVYNPQMFKGEKTHSRGSYKTSRNSNYGYYKPTSSINELGDLKYPRSIIKFQKPHPSKMVHPTEKSLECMEYLIKTYTNENDLVLDNCMGSGTTCLAALNTNRKFIGVEKNFEYFETALNKIESNSEKKLDICRYNF